MNRRSPFLLLAILLGIIVIGVLLAAFARPAPISPDDMTATSAADQALRSDALTALAMLPTAASTTEPGACAWQWATRDEPASAAAVKAALTGIDAEDVMVTASSFGENCLNPDMTVRSFAAMETSFRFEIETDSFEEAALGDMLAAVLTALQAYPPEERPGSNPGQIQIVFAMGEQIRDFQFREANALEIFATHGGGAELLNALDNAAGA